MAVSPIADTFGEAFLGLVFAAIFYGITLAQTVGYYNSYPNDSWKMKSLVGTLCVLDTVHIGLVIHVIWHYLIDLFMQPELMGFVVWSLLVQIMFSTVIACIVQGYYAWRIHILTRRWYISFFVMLFAVMHLVFDIYFATQLWDKTFLLIPGLTWATSISLAFSVASDLLIAGTMTFSLHSSRTGIDRTDTLINRLIAYTVSTGLTTTVVSLTTMILFAVSPTFLSQMFYFSLAKFYTNSLLASLNSRNSLRSMPSGQISGASGAIDLDNMRFTRSVARRVDDTATFTPSVHVNTSTYIDNDGYKGDTKSHLSLA